MFRFTFSGDYGFQYDKRIFFHVPNRPILAMSGCSSAWSYTIGCFTMSDAQENRSAPCLTEESSYKAPTASGIPPVSNLPD